MFRPSQEPHHSEDSHQKEYGVNIDLLTERRAETTGRLRSKLGGLNIIKNSPAVTFFFGNIRNKAWGAFGDTEEGLERREEKKTRDLRTNRDSFEEKMSTVFINKITSDSSIQEKIRKYLRIGGIDILDAAHTLSGIDKEIIRGDLDLIEDKFQDPEFLSRLLDRLGDFLSLGTDISRDNDEIEATVEKSKYADKIKALRKASSGNHDKLGIPGEDSDYVINHSPIVFAEALALAVKEVQQDRINTIKSTFKDNSELFEQSEYYRDAITQSVAESVKTAGGEELEPNEIQSHVVTIQADIDEFNVQTNIGTYPDEQREDYKAVAPVYQEFQRRRYLQPEERAQFLGYFKKVFSQNQINTRFAQYLTSIGVHADGQTLKKEFSSLYLAIEGRSNIGAKNYQDLDNELQKRLFDALYTFNKLSSPPTPQAATPQTPPSPPVQPPQPPATVAPAPAPEALPSPRDRLNKSDFLADKSINLPIGPKGYEIRGARLEYAYDMLSTLKLMYKNTFLLSSTSIYDDKSPLLANRLRRVHSRIIRLLNVQKALTNIIDENGDLESLTDTNNNRFGLLENDLVCLSQFEYLLQENLTLSVDDFRPGYLISKIDSVNPCKLHTSSLIDLWNASLLFDAHQEDVDDYLSDILKEVDGEHVFYNKYTLQVNVNNGLKVQYVQQKEVESPVLAPAATGETTPEALTALPTPEEQYKELTQLEYTATAILVMIGDNPIQVKLNQNNIVVNYWTDNEYTIRNDNDLPNQKAVLEYIYAYIKQQKNIIKVPANKKPGTVEFKEFVARKDKGDTFVVDNGLYNSSINYDLASHEGEVRGILNLETDDTESETITPREFNTRILTLKNEMSRWLTDYDTFKVAVSTFVTLKERFVPRARFAYDERSSDPNKANDPQYNHGYKHFDINDQHNSDHNGFTLDICNEFRNGDTDETASLNAIRYIMQQALFVDQSPTNGRYDLIPFVFISAFEGKVYDVITDFIKNNSLNGFDKANMNRLFDEFMNQIDQNNLRSELITQFTRIVNRQQGVALGGPLHPNLGSYTNLDRGDIKTESDAETESQESY